MSTNQPVNNNRFQAEGYISVWNAGLELGASNNFVRQCLRDGRLAGKSFLWKVRTVTMVSVESIEKLKPLLLSGEHGKWKLNRVGKKYGGAKRKSYIAKGYRYVYQLDHHRANQQGYVAEHHLVAEKVLGRPLTKDEVVHHINRDRADNSPNNLKIYSCNGGHLSSEHSEYIKLMHAVRGNPKFEKSVISHIKKLLKSK